MDRRGPPQGREGEPVTETKHLFRNNEYEMFDQNQTGVNPRDEGQEHLNRSDRVVDSGSSGHWYWEISTFAVAILCFAAIVGLLITLNEKKMPEWPSGLSVNVVLSVLVTVMKGAIGICLADCLSQIKWSWFQHERRLIDLVILDNASRGIWGAGQLLLTMRTWFLAYLGAFVFLAAFLVGPTVQMMVQINVRQVVMSGNATMPVCNATDSMNVIGLGSGAGQNRVHLPLVGAMYDELLQTSSQSPLRPGCSTGNCTFPRYQSLGFCHECTDYSNQLVYMNMTTNETMSTTENTTCSDQFGYGCQVR